MNQVYIIDFSNFAYKFKSVYTYARRNVNGVEVDISVLVGFIRALKANLADNIVIVLDGVPTQSNSVLPGYKGQRLHDDIAQFIGVPKVEVIQFLTKVGDLIGKNVEVVCSPGQETDEVISSIVHHVTGHLPARYKFISMLNTKAIESDRMLKYLTKVEVETEQYIPNYDTVVIASTDGDFIQLQRFPGVYIDTTASGKNISSKVTSKSTSGVTPIASIAYKAIYGDVSDNIPANKLPWKKEDVILWLNKGICVEEELMMFHKACTEGAAMRDIYLQKVADYIKENCSKQFEVNWTVAFLTFRSYPQKLKFPNYDIKTTIDKYKLKV